MKAILALILLALPGVSQASVADEIAALEAAKAQNPTQLLPGFPTGPLARMPRLMTLQDGRQIDLNNYALVVFMQQHCEYSAKFDPKLKSWADSNGMKVYPYTLDGNGDAAVPHPLVPRKAGPDEPLAGEIMTFFGNGLPIATPTTFMVNVNTNAAYPLIQGDTDMSTLSTRVAQMIEADLDHISSDQFGPLPTGQGMTPQ